MTGSLRSLARRFRALLHLDDAPWRIALALAIGVFISFTPLWGVQTLLSLLLATVFRLNKAVAVTGTWINLPWFAPFSYVGALKLGMLLAPDLTGFRGVGVALLIGTTIIGLGAGVVCYLIALGILTARRARRALGAPGPPPAEAGDARPAAGRGVS